MTNESLTKLFQRGGMIPDYLPVLSENQKTSWFKRAMSKSKNLAFGNSTFSKHWGTMAKTAIGGAIALPILFAMMNSVNKSENFDDRQISPEMRAHADMISQNKPLNTRKLAGSALTALPLAMLMRGGGPKGFLRGQGLYGTANNALKGLIGVTGGAALGSTAGRIANNSIYQRDIARSIRERNIMANPYAIRRGY